MADDLEYAQRQINILTTEQRIAKIRDLAEKGYSDDEIAQLDNQFKIITPAVRQELTRRTEISAAPAVPAAPSVPGIGEKIARVAGWPLRAVTAGGQAAVGGAFHPSQWEAIKARAVETLAGRRPEGMTFAEKAGGFIGEAVPMAAPYGAVMRPATMTARALGGALLAAAEAKAMQPEAGTKELLPAAAIGGAATGLLPILIEKGLVPYGRTAIAAAKKTLFERFGVPGWWAKAEPVAGLAEKTAVQAQRDARKQASAITANALSGDTAVNFLGEIGGKLIASDPVEVAVNQRGMALFNAGKMTEQTQLHLAQGVLTEYAPKAGESAERIYIRGFSDKPVTPEMVDFIQKGLGTNDPVAIRQAVAAFNVHGMKLGAVPVGEEITKATPTRGLLARFAKEVHRLNPRASPGMAMDELIGGLHAETKELAEQGIPAAARTVSVTPSQRLTQILGMMDANVKDFRVYLANAIRKQGYKIPELVTRTKAGATVVTPVAFGERVTGERITAIPKQKVYAKMFAPSDAAVQAVERINGSPVPIKDISTFESITLETDRVITRMGKDGFVLGATVYQPLRRAQILATKLSEITANKLAKAAPEFKDNRLMGDYLRKFIRNDPGAKEDILKRFGDKGYQRFDEVSRHLRDLYIRHLRIINRVRRMYGQEAIRYRADYEPQMQELTALAKIFGDITKVPSDIENYQGFLRPPTKFFRFALQRTGDVAMEDPVTAALTYVRMANQIGYITSPAQRFKNAVQLLDPNKYNFIRDKLLNAASEAQGITNPAEAGRLVSQFMGLPLMQKMVEIKNDIVQNLVIGNLATILNQTGSLPMLLSLVKPWDVVYAMMNLCNPAYRAGIMKVSMNLRSRQFMLHEFYPAARRLQGIPLAMAHLLNAIDSEISMISFAAGMRNGIRKGLEGRALEFYADGVANAVNRIYLASDASRLLRNRLVQFATPLQGYVWNGFNFLTHDMLKGHALTGVNPLWMGAKFLASAYVLSAIFHSFGLKSPLDWSDFIPFFRGGRFARGAATPITGEIQLLPVSTLVDLGSGLSAMLHGDFDKGWPKFFRGAMMTLPKGGGIQLWRILQKGMILPQYEPPKTQ